MTSKKVKHANNKQHTPKSRHEVRSLVSPLEIRTTENGQKKLVGTAIRFNQPSQLLGDGFVEYVSPTAVNLTRDKDILLLRDHEQSLLLARTTAPNSLKLSVDPNVGLKFEANLQNTDTANTAWTDIQSGLLTGCSWGFIVLDDKWEQQGNQLVRTILDMQIFELSVTSFPAYQSSSVSARSLDAIKRGLGGPGMPESADIDDDSDCDCDPDIDEDCDCDEDEDRKTTDGTVEVCSACGQSIRSSEEHEEYNAALKLLLARL